MTASQEHPFEGEALYASGPVDNKRSQERHVVTVAGRYRGRTGGSKDIWIKDISQTGCRIFDKFSILQVDSAILFRVGNIGPIPAKVRWREKSVVGLEFERPLHESVLEHIVRTMDEQED